MNNVHTYSPYSQLLTSATNAINGGDYSTDVNSYGLQSANAIADSNSLLSQDYLSQNRENYIEPSSIGRYEESVLNNLVAPESNYLNQASNGYAPASSNDPFGEASLSNLIESSAKMSCAVPPLTCGNDTSTLYYRTYDGSCNNLAYPGYGMANTRYGRLLKPKYGDGRYMPTRSATGAALPNPRILSLSLYGDDTFLDESRTLLTMQWGQIVGHDISELMDGAAGKLKIIIASPLILRPEI